MDGKRFAAGMLGGVFVAALIVVSSSLGPAGPAFQSLAHPAAQDQAGSGTRSTVETMVTYTRYNASGTFVVAQTATETLDGAYGAAQGSPIIVPIDASRVESITAQSASLNALILLPLVVATILGAALYRASRSKESEEPQTE